jgi:anaerobic ribonucleoside-triphosphate reductase
MVMLTELALFTRILQIIYEIDSLIRVSNASSVNNYYELTILFFKLSRKWSHESE